MQNGNASSARALGLARGFLFAFALGSPNQSFAGIVAFQDGEKSEVIASYAVAIDKALAFSKKDRWEWGFRNKDYSQRHSYGLADNSDQKILQAWVAVFRIGAFLFGSSEVTSPFKDKVDVKVVDWACGTEFKCQATVVIVACEKPCEDFFPMAVTELILRKGHRYEEVIKIPTESAGEIRTIAYVTGNQPTRIPVACKGLYTELIEDSHRFLEFFRARKAANP